jgi:ACS family hexuronate transporter-like MFS transporter
VLYGAPLYMSRALGQSQATIGALFWLPPLGWELGYLFWGYIVDARARAGDGGRPRDVAPLALLCVLAVLALPLAAIRALPGAAAPLAAFVLATFAAGGFIILGLAYATRAFGTGRAGLLGGLAAGSWSAFVALLMPVLGHMFDRGAYGAALAIPAVAPCAGIACWAWLDRQPRATRTAVP